ncbi:hypothetical protein BKA83DRAFT_4305835 [Pisolithus microcarpus]|nr:hypothetical protein BKA83DRAFT_4305835 [Pisolithus microcarpus]
MHCSEDASITQSVVAVVWILDTLHVSFMCHVLYYYLVKLRRSLLVTGVFNHFR